MDRRGKLLRHVIHHHSLGEVRPEQGTEFDMLRVMQVAGLGGFLAFKARREDMCQVGIELFRAHIQTPLEALYASSLSDLEMRFLS